MTGAGITHGPTLLQRTDLPWTGLALLLLLGHGLLFGFVIDDAYISFRYADNLLQGHGLVFNPGEPVEGYSNFLWVLLVAAGVKVGLPHLLWARILGGTAAALLLGAIPGTVRLLFPDTASGSLWPGRIARLAVAATGAVACWTLAGLETVLFALLILLAWRAALRRDPLAAGIAGLLLILTRPEGPGLAALLTAWSLLPGPVESGRPPSSRARRLAGPILLATGAIVYFLWRYSYYGYWLPNTYYAKTGDLAGQFRTGVPYGLTFLFLYGIPLAAASLAALVRGGPRRLLNREMILSLGLIAVWCSYATVVGGDMLGMYRFFVPVLPMLTTWTVVLMARVDWLAHTRRALVAGLLLAATLLPASFYGRERLLVTAHMWEANLGGWILAGDAMARQLPAGSSIALGPAGYIPWRTGLRTIDFYGLTDPVTVRGGGKFKTGYAGHEKMDAERLIAWKPDYILIGNVDITDHPRRDLIRPLVREKEIVLSRRFQAEYEQISIALADGKHLNLFRRRDDAP